MNCCKLFSEISYWEMLMFEIPHYAADVYQRREELRNLREHVMLVVRDYNRVITELNEEPLKQIMILKKPSLLTIFLQIMNSHKYELS